MFVKIFAKSLTKTHAHFVVSFAKSCANAFRVAQKREKVLKKLSKKEKRALKARKEGKESVKNPKRCNEKKR